MKTLFVIRDPPYGTERLYNRLRLAHALIKHDYQVIVFLMTDAVVLAKSGQKTPDGYYNTECMLRRIISKGKVLLCAPAWMPGVLPIMKFWMAQNAVRWMH